MKLVRQAWQALSVRPWVTAVVVVVVAGGAAGYLLVGGGSSSTAATQAGTTSRLVSVSTGTVSKSVSTTGNLEPAQDEDVSFPASAEVTSVRVRQGETVKKGQVLGTIDDLSLRASLASARSNLAAARASLVSAEDDDSMTSAQLTADRATVSTARAAVTSAVADLADATLRSPIAGTVAAVNVTKGDQSSGSSSSVSTGNADTSGATATGATDTASTSSSSGDFEVIGTSRWKVSVDVDDTEVGLIKKGQQAQLTTDNVSKTIFGIVTSVSVLSSSTSGSATYPVTVSITGTPAGLHDGAEATVSLIYRQVSNALTVPSAAVHRDGSTSYVYVSKDGSRVKRTVRTGITSGSTTQITSGLSSGQQVYVEVITPGGSGAGSAQRSGGNLPTGGFPTGGFPGGGSGFGGGAGGFGGAAGGN